MKKSVAQIIALFLLLAVVLCTGMSGCGQTGEDGPEESAVPTEPAPTGETPAIKPATIRFAGFSAGERYAGTLADMLDLFSAAYPQITVVDESAGYGDYFAELAARIGSGDAPDVFELNNEHFREFMGNGDIMPLNDLAARHGADMSAYQEGLRDICTLENLIGLPFSCSTVMLIYNMDLFDAAGAAYPAEEWTWDDVLIAAQKIAKPEEDIWGCYYPMQYFREFNKRIAQNGGYLFNYDEGVFSFAVDMPENVEALQWLQDLIWVYHVMPDEQEQAGRSEVELFGAGRLGMFLGDTGDFAGLRERCGDDMRWGVAVEPGKIEKATNVLCNILSVNGATEAPDAAFSLVNFLTGDPGVQRLRLDAEWDVPPVSDPDITEAYVRDTPPANKDAVLASITYFVAPPIMKDYGILANDILAPHLEAVRGNTEIPQEALEAAQAEAIAQIDLSDQ